MDRKGANTFPFYNLPPELRAISIRNFSVLLSFPFGENKRRWRLLLPRHFANQHKTVSSRSTDHRVHGCGKRRVLGEVLIFPNSMSLLLIIVRFCSPNISNLLLYQFFFLFPVSKFRILQIACIGLVKFRVYLEEPT